jgi:hypothetical protein
MLYTKPEVLNTRNAHSCIEGHDKQNDMVDSGQVGEQGTIGAYQADE